MMWNEVKKNITILSIKVEDERLLDGIPYIASDETEEVFVFYLETISFFAVGHLLVTNQMLEEWGVSVDVVYQQAFENLTTEKFFTTDNKRCMWRYIGLELMREQMLRCC